MAKNTKQSSAELFKALAQKKIETPIRETNEKTLLTEEPLVKEEDNIKEKEVLEEKPSEEVKDKVSVTAIMNEPKEEPVSKTIPEIHKSVQEPVSIKKSDKDYFQLSEYNLLNLKTFTLVMDSEIYEKFIMYCTINDIKRYNLANSIVESEIQWEKDHPEFPSTEFIKSNIKNIKNKQIAGRERLTINLTLDNIAFIKQRAKQCGMKMYTFVEYMFDKFID